MTYEALPKNLAETVRLHDRLFYVHIPKTGGNYIKKVALQGHFQPESSSGRGMFGTIVRLLGKNEPQSSPLLVNGGHCVCAKKPLDIAKYNRAWTTRCTDNPASRNSLVFSVVRNPFDLLVSMYTYGYPYRRPRPEKPKPELDRHGFPFSSFDEWVRAYCDPEDPWLVSYQHRFLFFQIFDDNSGCVPRYILRTECLDAGLKELLNPFGITPKVSDNYVNPSRTGRKKDFRIFYTDELRELVERKCERELRAFGYSFDGHDERVVIDPSAIRYNPHTDEFSLSENR